MSFARYSKCSRSVTKSSGTLISLPQQSYGFWNTYKYSRAVISVSEQLVSATEQLQSVPMQLRKCSGEVSKCSGVVSKCSGVVNKSSETLLSLP